MEGTVAGLTLCQSNSRLLLVKHMKVLPFCLFFIFMFLLEKSVVFVHIVAVFRLSQNQGGFVCY